MHVHLEMKHRHHQSAIKSGAAQDHASERALQRLYLVSSDMKGSCQRIVWNQHGAVYISAVLNRLQSHSETRNCLKNCSGNFIFQIKQKLTKFKFGSELEKPHMCITVQAYRDISYCGFSKKIHPGLFFCLFHVLLFCLKLIHLYVCFWWWLGSGSCIITLFNGQKKKKINWKCKRSLCV